MNSIHPSPSTHPPEQAQITAQAITDLSDIPGAPLIGRMSMRIGLWLLLRAVRHSLPQDQVQREHELQRISEAARSEHGSAVARAQTMGARAPFQQ